jgi:hypothetical protein
MIGLWADRQNPANPAISCLSSPGMRAAIDSGTDQTILKTKIMKTTELKKLAGRNRGAWRISSLAALLVCAGWSAQASLAQLNTDQLLQTDLQQLSTGLQINSASDNTVADSSTYVWQKVAPDVLALSYNAPLQSGNQDQQLLQLLMGGDPVTTKISTLALANQNIANLLAIASVATLQQAPVQQSVLKLFSDNAGATAAAQSQQSAADQLTLSLVSQSLPTQVASLAVANLLPSAVGLVKGCQEVSLSTGLRINQSSDPAQLAVYTQNGLVLQLIQNQDGYDSTLGLNTAGLSLNNASVGALLPDPVSQKVLQNPLVSADFVAVGQLSQATAMDFFQLSQSVNGNYLSSLARDNAANLAGQFGTSVIALRNLNSPYLFVSIRDQWGADAQDYNSAVFAVNIGQANVQSLCATPEPSLCLTLGGFMVVALSAKRRLKRRAILTAA